MALMKCPECEGKMSDQACFCPHCGFPLPTQWVTGIQAVFVLLGCITVVVSILGFWGALDKVLSTLLLAGGLVCVIYGLSKKAKARGIS